jgi:hypothetical protein
MKSKNISKESRMLDGSGTYRLGGKGLDLVVDEFDQGLFMHLGIDYNNLTQNQVDTILIPSHAPENYMCDGEINSKEAEKRWIKQLVATGLSTNDIARALKLVS